MTNEEFQNLVLEKLGGLDSKMGGLESRMDRFETKVDGLDSKVDRLETRMDGLESKVDRLETKMDAGFQQLVSMVDLLGKKVDRLPLIEAKIDMLNNRLLENEANIQILKAAK